MNINVSGDRTTALNAAHKPVHLGIDLKAKKLISLGGINMAVFLLVDNIFNHLKQVGVFSSTGRADQIARLPENQMLLIEKLQQGRKRDKKMQRSSLALKKNYFTDKIRTWLSAQAID